MVDTRATVDRTPLPPGQRPIDWFPRFGKDLAGPPPKVPVDSLIAVRGAVTKMLDVPVAALATLPRRELVADFHCVAGWTATNLRWEGVAFETFYRGTITPVLSPDTVITHLAFRGLDGYRSVVAIEDALADDVLLADRLDGRPLDGDHGAPARLVSPNQYGYVSAKHLCGIEVLTAAPAGHRASRLVGLLFQVHPRARVWQEERHGSLPTWLIRPLYRALNRPMLAFSARGARRERTPPPSTDRGPS